MYVEVDRCHIALFKFILESYDNLAYLSVLDKYRAMVRITFSPDAAQTVYALIHDLAAAGEISIRQVFHMNQPGGSFHPGRQET